MNDGVTRVVDAVRTAALSVLVQNCLSLEHLHSVPASLLLLVLGDFFPGLFCCFVDKVVELVNVLYARHCATKFQRLIQNKERNDQRTCQEAHSQLYIKESLKSEL